MCIVFVWIAEDNGADEDAPFSFILASNRDEFHERPSAPLHRWETDGNVFYAGKDLEAGGTWCGVGEDGKFAVITNYRALQEDTDNETEYTSRGGLALSYLKSSDSPSEHAAKLRQTMGDYKGYNLLFGNVKTDKLWYVTNRYESEKEKEAKGCPYGVQVSKELAQGECCIGCGVHGLTNAILETPWQKLTRGKALVSDVVNAIPKGATFEESRREVAEALIHKVLGDAERIEPKEENRYLFPNTGWPLDKEANLSSIFVKPFPIHGRDYGTRTSTVMLVNREKTLLTVYEYNLDGKEWMLSENTITLTPSCDTVDVSGKRERVAE